MAIPGVLCKFRGQVVGSAYLRWGLCWGAGFLTGWVYFRQWLWAVATMAVLGSLAGGFARHLAGCNQQRTLASQLSQTLNFLTFYLSAGMSLSEATQAVLKELEQLWGSQAKLTRAWHQATSRLLLNQPVSLVYDQLAQQLQLEQAFLLAGILRISLKTGANMVRVIQNLNQQIRSQLEFQEARRAKLAARRLEGGILMAAPLCMTLLLTQLLRDYMLPLYSGKGLGVMLMVMILQVGGGSCFMGILLQENCRGELGTAEFMECLALLLQTGLNLPAAWHYACALENQTNPMPRYLVRSKAKDKSSFAKALRQAQGVLDLSGSMSSALLQMVSQGGVVGGLAVLLQQNLHKGGGNLAQILAQEAAQLRQQHLLQMQSQGSRQETWILFPMMLLLLSVLLLTAGPALLSL